MVVLIVEDNRSLAANMIEYLEAEGFECDYAERGDHGLKLAQSESFDAIVLDVMLPGLDGMSVCQKLREEGNSTPIIMLTARDTLEDKLQGFDVGANDYLVKPFDLPELVARLRVMNNNPRQTTENLKIADLEVNLERREVKRSQQLIHLNPACWQLLVTLMRASPRVMSREEMEQALWSGTPPDSDSLKSHLYQLRKSIDKPFDSALIHTLRGVGVVIKE